MEKQYEDLWLKYQSLINQGQYVYKNKHDQDGVIEQREQLEAAPQYYDQIEEYMERPPKRKRNHEETENNWGLY